MDGKEARYRNLNITALAIAGILMLFLLATILLLHGNFTNNQAQAALVAQVYFDGEYRIADGEWHQIEKGKHISSTDGDVMLRGKFHTPEYFVMLKNYI